MSPLTWMQRVCGRWSQGPGCRAVWRSLWLSWTTLILLFGKSLGSALPLKHHPVRDPEPLAEELIKMMHSRPPPAPLGLCTASFDTFIFLTHPTSTANACPECLCPPRLEFINTLHLHGKNCLLISLSHRRTFLHLVTPNYYIHPQALYSVVFL